ncbi:MAG: hypothetical protein AAGA48_38160 [Myxococcota bacterium]
MRSPGLWLLALSACSPRPLLEVPITGADEATEQLLSEGVAQFERWVGPGRVRLAEISVGPVPEDFLGRYNRIRQSVLLSEDIEDDSRLVQVLYHELCHALDFQNRIVKDDRSLFEQLSDPSSNFVGLPSPEGHLSSSQLPHEVFADMCEFGPVVHQAMAHSCPAEETDPLPSVAQWFFDEVWLGEVPASWVAGPPVTWEASFEPDIVYGYASEDEVALVLLLARDLGGEAEQTDYPLLNVKDGSPMVASEVNVGWAVEPYYIDIPEALPWWATLTQGVSEQISVPYNRYVHSEDDAAALVDVRAPFLQERLRRMLVLDDGWRATNACPGELGGLFRAQDTFYVISAEGRVVTWQALRPSEVR